MIQNIRADLGNPCASGGNGTFPKMIASPGGHMDPQVAPVWCNKELQELNMKEGSNLGFSHTLILACCSSIPALPFLLPLLSDRLPIAPPGDISGRRAVPVRWVPINSLCSLSNNHGHLLFPLIPRETDPLADGNFTEPR